MSDFQYDDILNVKYPNLEIERDFPNNLLRAAQFAPFAALTGHDDAIEETARQTDKKSELDEYKKDEINRRLNFLQQHIDEEILVKITFFIADEKKSGGKYIVKSGVATKVREFEKVVVLDDETEIPIDDILEIEFSQINEFDI